MADAQTVVASAPQCFVSSILARSGESRADAKRMRVGDVLQAQVTGVTSKCQIVLNVDEKKLIG